MPEQLSLFAEENTLFNVGIQRLLEMDFAGCLEVLGRYRKLFPWGRDVSCAMEMTSFLNTRLVKETRVAIDQEEGERRYQIWQEFEAAFDYPWRPGSLEERLQVKYFSMLTDGLLSSGYGEITALPDGTPTGLIYLLAGRVRQAVASLQSLIREKSDDATAHGYLGDAYFQLGDVRRARLCYREAFAIEPSQVDLKRLQDNETKEFLDALSEDEEFEGDPIAWFPVAAQLEGIFERRVSSDQADLDHWLARYLELIEGHKMHEDRALIPRLFYHAMVLSDNAHMMKHAEKTDVLEVRRNMRKWHPVLFARYMEMLESKEKRP